MANPANEVYRCTATEKGKRCVCEFTLANAYSYTYSTIRRRNKGELTWATIRKQVICPMHARLLGYVRKDICPLVDVLPAFQDYRKKLKLLRAIEEHDRKTVEQNKRRLRTPTIPAMAMVMQVAGVGTEWPRRQ